MRIMIVGCGRSVHFLSRDLLLRGDQVTLIVPDPGEARSLARRCDGAVVVTGNGSRLGTLAEAGTRMMDVFVALMSRDEDNLIACQIASTEFGVRRTVALVQDPQMETVFLSLGVTAVVSAASVLSKLVEEQAVREDIVSLVPISGGRLTAAEIYVPEGARIGGSKLSDLRLPENALLAAVLRGRDTFVPNEGDEVRAGDRLILVSTPEAYQVAVGRILGEDKD